MNKPLVAVQFNTGKKRQPRLSKPYVPGVHSERYWSAAEQQILRDYFSKKGMAYCLLKLPGRTPSGIYQRARNLGLKGGRRGAGRKALNGAYERPGIDSEIREGWPMLNGRGAVNAFADTLKVPRWWLTKRATKLGLTIFREHGFARSPTAIMVRCKRIGLSRRDRPHLSASAAALILGLDNKTVSVWCLQGRLKASRSGTKRLTQQGGDRWAIERWDLRQFVLDNIEAIDIRKVDKVAFVDLLANTPPPAPVQSVPRRADAIASEARVIAHRAKNLKNRGIAAAHAAGVI